MIKITQKKMLRLKIIYNNFIVLQELLTKYSITEISDYLNITPNTIKRWLELKDVPRAYEIELLQLNGCKINYSFYSYKEKDQFYTDKITAQYSYEKLLAIMKSKQDNDGDYIFIEPSAGSGNFSQLLPADRMIAMDIEPKGPNIEAKNYLTWCPKDDKKYCVIGNPPFGLRGHLALKFINHSSKFADYVAFILPQLFISDGKGVPRKRVKGLNLIHSEDIKANFTNPELEQIKINCIFQIWSKHHSDDKYLLTETKNTNIKIYSLSDGGTPSTTRNKNMFDKCDIYLPSTCFGRENMTYYESFKSLPSEKGYGILFLTDKKEYISKFKQIKWDQVAFLSTNSAYNIRSSQILAQFS